MKVFIAFAGWRGDMAVLGVYASKDMAEAKAATYNAETGYTQESGNAATVFEFEVMAQSDASEKQP